MWRCFHSFPAGKKLYTNINYNATYLESEEGSCRIDCDFLETTLKKHHTITISDAPLHANLRAPKQAPSFSLSNQVPLLQLPPHAAFTAPQQQASQLLYRDQQQQLDRNTGEALPEITPATPEGYTDQAYWAINPQFNASQQELYQQMCKAREAAQGCQAQAISLDLHLCHARLTAKEKVAGLRIAQQQLQDAPFDNLASCKVDLLQRQAAETAEVVARLQQQLSVTQYQASRHAFAAEQLGALMHKQQQQQQQQHRGTPYAQLQQQKQQLRHSRSYLPPPAFAASTAAGSCTPLHLQAAHATGQHMGHRVPLWATGHSIVNVPTLQTTMSAPSSIQQPTESFPLAPLPKPSLSGPTNTPGGAHKQPKTRLLAPLGLGSPTAPNSATEGTQPQPPPVQLAASGCSWEVKLGVQVTPLKSPGATQKAPKVPEAAAAAAAAEKDAEGRSGSMTDDLGHLPAVDQAEQGPDSRSSTPSLEPSADFAVSPRPVAHARRKPEAFFISSGTFCGGSSFSQAAAACSVAVDKPATHHQQQQQQLQGQGPAANAHAEGSEGGRRAGSSYGGMPPVAFYISSDTYKSKQASTPRTSALSPTRKSHSAGGLRSLTAARYSRDPLRSSISAGGNTKGPSAAVIISAGRSALAGRTAAAAVPRSLMVFAATAEEATAADNSGTASKSFSGMGDTSAQQTPTVGSAYSSQVPGSQPSPRKFVDCGLGLQRLSQVQPAGSGLYSGRIVTDAAMDSVSQGSDSSTRVRRISHHGEKPLADGMLGSTSSAGSSNRVSPEATKLAVSSAQCHRYSSSSDSECSHSASHSDTESPASIPNMPAHVKAAAMARSAELVHAHSRDSTVDVQRSGNAAGTAGQTFRKQQPTHLSSKSYFSQTMATLDKPYKLTAADIAYGKALGADQVKSWSGPYHSNGRRRRQPGDLAPHIAKLQDTHSDVIAEFELYKASAKRGNRVPVCRSIAATGTCDICCA